MDLALSVKQLFDFAGDDPNRPFRPVIEKDFGQQRYLTEDPTMSFQLCQFEKVPVLAGVTRYEKLSHALGEYMLIVAMFELYSNVFLQPLLGVKYIRNN